MRKNDRVKDPIPWQGAADHKISYALACGAFEDFHEEETTERLFYDIDNSGLSENSEYLLRLREKIMYILDHLTERERSVLLLRFGIVDGYRRTLKEVGRQFNVTPETIRRVEAKALRKMRHPTRIRQLHDFIEWDDPSIYRPPNTYLPIARFY
tara:strand:- start:1161 stop:1622 length:462 start_codon:yes stop_codon:yes gene_type:complete